MTARRCELCGAECGPRRIARGLCAPCYDGARSRGILDRFPPLQRGVPLAEVVDEWTRPGASVDTVAVRLGMHRESVRRAVTRARAAGLVAA